MPTHTTLNISVTPDVLLQLKALAAADGLPVLTFARKVLKQYINAHPPTPVPDSLVARSIPEDTQP